MIEKFTVAKQVAPGLEEYLVYTPEVGSKVSVSRFQGNLMASSPAIIKLYWKFNTANETLLWSIKGSQDLTVPIVIPTNEIDGVNSIGLALDNPCQESHTMSALLILEIE